MVELGLGLVPCFLSIRPEQRSLAEAKPWDGLAFL